MTDTMQAKRDAIRRDAFLMLADEKPPLKPKQWLVLWISMNGTDIFTEFSSHERAADAESMAEWVRENVTEAVEIHDLDNQ